MYNKALDNFKTVADYGSFSKAAANLYITHTALIKQMNSLEASLKVKLFYRTNHGITLTPAGIVLYAKLEEIIKLSQQTIFEVQKAHNQGPKVLLMGTSTLYPCHVFMDIWNQISAKYPQFELKIITFDNDANRLNLLDHAFDFIVGPFNTNMTRKCYNFIPLGSYKFCLAMNRNHCLAKHKTLSLNDLSNQNIRIMKPGNSLINDKIRHFITEHFKDIHIIDINPSYDMNTFNTCAQSQDLLLSLECWKDIHPSLTSVILQEEFELPYGIVTAKKLNATTKEFLSIVHDLLNY